LGRSAPRWHLPLRPVRAAAGIGELASRLIGRAPLLSRASINKYMEDIVVESDRIRAELGFVPGFDLRAGWCEAIAAMREAGEL